MKKITCILLSLLILFLTACSSPDLTGKNTGSAVELSMKESSMIYAAKEMAYSEDFWIDAFIVDSDTVFYIGGFGEQCGLRRIDIKTQTQQSLWESSAGNLHLIDICSDEGKLFVLAESYTEEGFVEYKILEFDKTGILLNEFLPDISSAQNDFFPGQIEAHDGYIYLIGSGTLCLFKYGKGLSFLSSEPVSQSAVITKLYNGKIAVGEAGNSGYTLRLLRAKSIETEDERSFDLAFSRINVGISHDIYLDDGRNIYSFDFKSGELVKLFSWSNMGLFSGDIGECTDGSFVSDASFNAMQRSPFMLFTPTDYSDTIVQQNKIVIATASPVSQNYILQQAIQRWNSGHPDCPIEVRDYSVYYDENEPRAMELKMLADIISGNLPDIYEFTPAWKGTTLSSGLLARKGMLEDLYPYIDNAADISREDFFGGVLSSHEINGKLYELTVQYRVLTSFASAKDVGNDGKLSYSYLNNLVDESDYYRSVFTTYENRMSWLEQAIDASGNKLVDWESGKCSFDSEYFVSLLELANTLPEDSSEFNASVKDDIANGTGILYLISLDSLWVVSAAAMVYGQDCAFLGLPELGNVVCPETCFGMSSVSQSKELCWEFLQTMLVSPTGPEKTTEFSMLRAVEQAHMDAELKMAQDNNYIQYHPNAEFAMNKLMEALEDVSSVSRHDGQIWEIVQSEVGAYFDGAESAWKTASDIQSRASIYLAEQG